MTEALLRAVLDTLLPGGENGLPSGSAVLVDLERYGAPAGPVLARLAHAAFLTGGEAGRAQALSQVDSEIPKEFRAFAVAVIGDYYETAQVCQALGWRAAPPQPAGHAVAEADRETLDRLARVRGRAPLWRR